MAGNGIALLGIRVRVIRTIIGRIWFPSRKLDSSWHGMSLSKCEPTDEQLKTRHSGTWPLLLTGRIGGNDAPCRSSKFNICYWGSETTMGECPLKFFKNAIFLPVLSQQGATLVRQRRYVAIAPETLVPSPSLRGHIEL